MPLLNYNSASSEETLYHAQNIIDFFSTSLKNAGCLSHIPITIVAEADHHEDKIESTIDALDDYNKPDVSVNVNDPIRAAIRRASGRNCFDCKPTMPDVRFNGMKGQIFTDAKDFLNKIKAIKGAGSFKNALPSLAALFGSFCIPDLIKLLSLLLASIIRITFSLDVSKFSFMKLLVAILARLLGHLLKFSRASMKLSLSPIMCIIDALVQLNNSLVPQKNIAIGVSITGESGVELHTKTDKERAKSIEDKTAILKQKDASSDTAIFLGTSVRSSSVNMKNFEAIKSLRDSIKSKLPEQKDADKLKGQVEQLQETINKSLGDMEDYIYDIFSLGQAIQCESERSTKKASDSIEEVMRLLQLINLIRSVIKKKTRLIAVQIRQQPDYDFYQDVSLSAHDIADVVGEATGTLGKLYTSPDGDIGILLTKNNDPFTETALSLYSCNINDFIKETHMDKVIEDAKIFADNNTVGQGNNPSYFTDEYIVVGDEDFIPFDINNSDVLKTLSDILGFLNTKNPYDDLASFTNTISPTLNIAQKIDTTLGDIGKIRI